MRTSGAAKKKDRNACAFFYFPHSGCRSQAGERAKAKASGKIYRPRVVRRHKTFLHTQREHGERSARLRMMHKGERKNLQMPGALCLQRVPLKALCLCQWDPI